MATTMTNYDDNNNINSNGNNDDNNLNNVNNFGQNFPPSILLSLLLLLFLLLILLHGIASLAKHFFSQKINPHILSRTISVSPGFLLPSLNSTIGATMTLAVHSCMYFTTWKILHHRLPIPYHNQCDQASKEKKPNVHKNGLKSCHSTFAKNLFFSRQTKMSSNIWATFVSKFVRKNLQKSPDPVTLTTTHDF